jgi:hypothetical protein
MQTDEQAGLDQGSVHLLLHDEGKYQAYRRKNLLSHSLIFSPVTFSMDVEQ